MLAASGVMPWLDDIDLRAAAATRRSLRERWTAEEIREAALSALAELIGVDRAAWGASEPGERYRLSLALHPAREETVVVGLGRSERVFSERDRDLAALLAPGIEGALRDAHARRLAASPPPGTAIVLLDAYGEIEHSSLEAERWLAEHFGPAEHPGWLPTTVAGWLALPPRPPLVSVRGDRCLTVTLLPGDPHVLLLEETHSAFRAEALTDLGLSAREREVLEAARVLGDDERALAGELFLSPHAVHERLERAEARLGVASAAAAVAKALRASA